MPVRRWRVGCKIREVNASESIKKLSIGMEIPIFPPGISRSALGGVVTLVLASIMKHLIAQGSRQTPRNITALDLDPKSLEHVRKRKIREVVVSPHVDAFHITWVAGRVQAPIQVVNGES